ncbi:MAG: hypothetical protein LLF99_14830 [Desulfobacteraceae bacterium]|nr:hypothetical protein [Desulfobacteraceae bacterium]
MVKKVVSLLVGFGLVAAGVVGITLSLADRDKKAALKEIEMAREANRAILAEEQKRIDEKRQEVENLAKNVDTEKQRLEAEHRRQEEHLRYKAAVIEEQKKAALERKKDAAGNETKARAEAAKKENRKAVALAEKNKAQKKMYASGSGSGRTVNSEASSLNRPADAINSIGRKAGKEAARLFEPVEYYNRETRELLRAEPYDRDRGWVRVRIRIWRDERLVKDTLVGFSRSDLGDLRGSRV